MKINFKIPTKALAIVFGLTTLNLAAPTVANAFTCPIDFASPRTVLRPQIKASETGIILALNAMDKSVATALDFQTATISAAVNTLTSQKALSANQVGQSVLNNSQIQTAAIQQLETAHKMKEVIKDYGANSAGHQVCQVLAEREQIHETQQITKDAVMGMVNSEITARPGKYSSSGSALATRLALHDALYCTAGQAASGLCSGVAPRAAKSLQASTLFIPSDENSPEYRDKSALINNMVGLPDDPLTKEQAVTVAGQSYSDLKRRKDAIKSTAYTSLKTIQAQYSSFAGNHKDTAGAPVMANSEAQQLADAGKMPAVKEGEAPKTPDVTPVAVQIQNDVKRYLGSGPEYQEWSKTLVGAEERGVLKEVLQVKALRLYLQAQQYEQLSRMEAMLASTVAAETYRTGMESNIERQRQAVVRRNIKGGL